MNGSLIMCEFSERELPPVRVSLSEKRSSQLGVSGQVCLSLLQHQRWNVTKCNYSTNCT